VPASLEAAGLANRPWDAQQARIAAQITARELTQINNELSEADRLGDRSAALTSGEHLERILISWNDQPYDGAAQSYRACRLAAAHLTGCALAVTLGGRCTERERFAATHAACAQQAD
jgi:hypothetical protein